MNTGARTSTSMLFLAPAAILLRLALWAVVAVGIAVPLLWLDYAVHTERHRILVEYLHPDRGDATVAGIPEPQQAPIYQNQTGGVVLSVNHEDRRVLMGLRTPFGDSRDAVRGQLRERCYYDAKLVAYDDLWHEQLMRRVERRRETAYEGMDIRRPLAIVDATFAYCDPNGLTRRERRERDMPQTAGQWLDLLTRQPRPAPSN
jgi:hypothetical protein